jgi:hypothetical protein
LYNCRGTETADTNLREVRIGGKKDILRLEVTVYNILKKNILLYLFPDYKTSIGEADF